MSTFKFIHAADLHLDTPFAGISCIDTQAGKRMQDASLEAWDNLVNGAIRAKVAFILLAGDIYDSSDRGVRAQLRFHSGLTKLHAAGIQCFVIYGNHDPLDGWSAIQEFPKNTKIFGHSQIDEAQVLREGRVIATVYGVSYGQRVVRENLALKFPPRGSTQGFRIGLLHCTVGQYTEHEPYSPCTIENLLAAGMNYWALGHIHLRMALLQDSRCHIHYSGNLQGRSMKSSEQGEKGALLIHVENDRVSQTEFLPFDVVRCSDVNIDCSGIRDLPALERALDYEMTGLRQKHSSKGLLLRAQLNGRTDLNRDLRRPMVRDELLSSMRERTIGMSPFVWWSDIRDNTHAPVDLTKIRGSGDFRDILLQLSESLGKDEKRKQQFLEETLATPGMVKPYLEEIDRIEMSSMDAIWKDALELALDLLSADE